jgi:PilZ domain
MESNKRIAPRQRVLKAGRIVVSDRATLDVGVRDMSATGAKLMCTSTHLVPDTFRFVLPGDGTIRPAKVVWRKQDSLGIEFTGEAKQSVLRKT